LRETLAVVATGDALNGVEDVAFNHVYFPNRIIRPRERGNGFRREVRTTGSCGEKNAGVTSWKPTKKSGFTTKA